MIALDRGLFEGPVHPLDLTVGPWVVGLGQPVLDVAFSADLVEAIDAVRGGGAAAVLGRLGELDAIVGQDVCSR